MNQSFLINFKKPQDRVVHTRAGQRYTRVKETSRCHPMDKGQKTDESREANQGVGKHENDLRLSHSGDTQGSHLEKGKEILDD